MTNVKIKDVKAQHIASIRVTVSMAEISKTFGEIFPEIMGYLQKIGSYPIGPPLSLYHNHDENAMDVEVGIPIAVPIPEEGRIISGKTPEGKTAYTLHIGPYETLPTAYSTIMTWMKENGKELSGPAWEIYLTGPQEESDTSKWRTEIYWPYK